MNKSSSKWRIYVFIGVIIYFFAINQVLHVRPDHIFLALIVLTLTFGKSKARKFLIDWLPFVVFWIFYDMMRGVADSWRGVIHIKDVYDFELMLFGWLFDGKVPAFFFHDFQQAFSGMWFKNILDLLSANLYTIHFGAPLITGWVLWHTTNDRKMYYRFAYTLTVLNMMGLITFFLFPAAPPWYVFKYGFVQPHGDLTGAAGSLIAVDQMLKMNFFTTLWDNFNPNRFAAIPSLHGAYPIVVAVFFYLKFKKKLLFLLFYPVLTWFAAVYLNQHYIIDLMIGGIYVFIAYNITTKVLFPYIFNKTIFRNGETATFPEKIKRDKYEVKKPIVEDVEAA